MTTLVVDFNMTRRDGTVPALIRSADIRDLSPGTKVVATDGEGTECAAVVNRILEARGIAYLTPIGGTWRHNSAFRPSSHDLFA